MNGSTKKMYININIYIYIYKYVYIMYISEYVTK